jgi:hypothetical protein
MFRLPALLGHTAALHVSLVTRFMSTLRGVEKKSNVVVVPVRLSVKSAVP